MNETVNQRYTLATAFVGQYDALIQEEIGARYAFEMARRRPSATPEVMEDTKDRLQQLKLAEWKLLQLDKIIESLTGLSIVTLRTTVDNLRTVLSRRAEIEEEFLRRTLLTTLMREVEAPTATKEVLHELDERLKEIPNVHAHLEALTALAESIADNIKYNPITAIIPVSSTILTAS